MLAILGSNVDPDSCADVGTEHVSAVAVCSTHPRPVDAVTCALSHSC